MSKYDDVAELALAMKKYGLSARELLEAKQAIDGMTAAAKTPTPRPFTPRELYVLIAAKVKIMTVGEQWHREDIYKAAHWVETDDGAQSLGFKNTRGMARWLGNRVSEAGLTTDSGSLSYTKPAGVIAL